MNVDKISVLEVIKNSGISADFESIADGDSFTDAGVDSLEIMNLFLAIEEEYDIKVPDDKLDELLNLETLTNYLSSQ